MKKKILNLYHITQEFIILHFQMSQVQNGSYVQNQKQSFRRSVFTLGTLEENVSFVMSSF